MFSLYLNLAYYIPHIYLFFRVKNNFIGLKYRSLYIVVYLFLASIYPIAGRHPDRSNEFMRVMAAISDYLLPFYLYLFLLLIVYDLFLLINLIVKGIDRNTVKSFHFRTTAFSTLILLSAAVVTWGAINLNTIRISEYRIEIPRGNSNLEKLRIAFVADAHFEENFPISFVEQFATNVNDIHPDILLFGGDIVEGSRINGGMEKIESLIAGIKTKYGKFGIYGNHEGYGRRNPEGFFQRAGIKMLADTVFSFDSLFYLAGRLDQNRRRMAVDQLITNKYADLPLISLNHRPTELQETSLTTADIQFSGHTHNGQLFPLNFFIQDMYELAWGYKKIRNTHFFVTSGLRLWGPPVKTSGKSEIMLVDIEFK